MWKNTISEIRQKSSPENRLGQYLATVMLEVETIQSTYTRSEYQDDSQNNKGLAINGHKQHVALRER